MAAQLAEGHADGGGDFSPGARRRSDLMEDCREIVITRLSKVVSEALVRMSDDLTALALKAASQDEQRTLLDAVAIVRQHRPEIEVRFRRSFGEVFERRLHDRCAPQPADPAVNPSELTLVDDAAIRRQITVDRLVGRARSRLDPDEVLGVRARLAALLDRDWFEDAGHPASPEAVFEALKAALAELAPSPEVAVALLAAFEPHVTTNLNAIYADVNEKLRARQVLPKIRRRLVNDGGSSRVAGVDHGLAGEEGSGRPAPGAAGDFGPEAFGFAGQGPDVMQQVLQLLAQGQPSAKLAAASMLVAPERFGVADLPMPSAASPLLDALSALQTDVGASPVAAPALVTELAERARDRGSSLDQLTVEIVSLVFDYIYSDRRLPDPIKQQLLRLQVVAVKAALLDRSFFARRQHPMRRVIDRITECATDPDIDLTADAPLTTGLAGVVDWIIAGFDKDLAIFDEALARIERLAQDEAARRAEKLADITRHAEREEAIAIARNEARFQFGLRQDGDTPAFVREFLDEWWSSAIAVAKVDDDGGDAQARWHDGLDLADALIWSVAPKSADEVPRLAALLPRLIGGVMVGLKRTTISDPVREAFFAELLRTHTAAIQTAKALRRRVVAAREAVLARPAAETDLDASAAAPADPGTREAQAAGDAAAGGIPALRAAANLPDTQGDLDGLSRGDIVELDDSGESKRFKLAWISPSRALFVLTRFGDQARSLNREQFGDLLARGLGRVVDGRSTFDQALASLSVQSQSGERAAAGTVVASAAAATRPGARAVPAG